MTKGIRNTIIIIIVILFVFSIIFAIYQHYKAEPMDANTTVDNILDNPNDGLENMLNEIFDEENITNEQNEENANTQTENTSTNKNITTTNNNTSISTNTKQNDNEVTEDDNSMTPKETKAIELVKEQWKKDWGSIKDVSFNVSIQSDGKYGVTVYDTTTTQSIQFYIVDVDTEIVKER